MNSWTEDIELNLYGDMVKSEHTADISPGMLSSTDVSPLNWDSEAFVWNVEDLNTDLFDGALPLSVETIDDENNNVNQPTSSICSPCDNEESSTTENGHSNKLMAKYGFSDDVLSDMTLKQLKKWCSADEQDYKTLKSYRRTCLNRGYARSSRSKQQEKAQSLSAQLRAAEDKIKQLTKELREKDMRIQYLELENRLLLDFNKDK